jgi:hypothetical protein
LTESSKAVAGFVFAIASTEDTEDTEGRHKEEDKLRHRHRQRQRRDTPSYSGGRFFESQESELESSISSETLESDRRTIKGATTVASPDRSSSTSFHLVGDSGELYERHLQADVGTTVGKPRPYGMSLCTDELNHNWCSNGCPSQFYKVLGTGDLMTASTECVDWDTRIIVREGEPSEPCWAHRCVGTCRSCTLGMLSSTSEAVLTSRHSYRLRSMPNSKQRQQCLPWVHCRTRTILGDLGFIRRQNISHTSNRAFFRADKHRQIQPRREWHECWAD